MAGSEPAKKDRLKSINSAEERSLVVAAQRDPAQFIDLYESNFPAVYGYIARRVRDRSLAEEFTSEVFHRALANLPRFKWTGAPFATWLFRIASNLIAERLKRAAREGDHAVNLSRASEISELPLKQKELEQLERQTHLNRLVDELPRDQRQVLIMRFAEEKSIREIALKLDRSEGAIKQLQFRALQSLRRTLMSNE